MYMYMYIYIYIYIYLYISYGWAGRPGLLGWVCFRPVKSSDFLKIANALTDLYITIIETSVPLHYSIHRKRSCCRPGRSERFYGSI